MPESGWPLEGGYRLDLFSEQQAVSSADVIAVWVSQVRMPAAIAEQRVGQLLLVATDAQGELAGMSSAYLKRNEQLQAQLWYYRAYVRPEHRLSSLAVSLAVTGREYLVNRFVSGEDRRGLGVLYEVENESLRRYFPLALWTPADFVFVGENAQGDHVRVHYFPGAHAPEPG